MAGAMVTIPTNHWEMENTAIFPIIEQWQVQYSRFINYSSSNFGSTHASLSPLATVQKKHPRGGVWISSSFTTCLKLVSDRSNGCSDAILLLSLRAKVLEILDSAKLQGLPCDSDLSYQADSVPSVGPAYRPEENWQYTTSADTSTHLMPPIDKAQDSNPQESSHNVADEVILPTFPPSFTSLLKNCYPAANEGCSNNESAPASTNVAICFSCSNISKVLRSKIYWLR
ncbi:protein POOR-like proteinOUS SYNAPSIS 1 [Forsythia ovata]|uniref:Protein POOR-like proteinOUS SYNAPSIS 1 n=1 Tax=Forsythia ovata TaxID=205694 RepID=A0ABD1TC31_9LAMI